MLGTSRAEKEKQNLPWGGYSEPAGICLRWRFIGTLGLCIPWSALLLCCTLLDTLGACFIFSMTECCRWILEKDTDRTLCNI